MYKILPVVTFCALGVLFVVASYPANSVRRLAASELPVQEENFEIQLAKAHVALSKLDLERALAANSREAGVISGEEIDKLKLHVEFDEAYLNQLLEHKTLDTHQAGVSAVRGWVEASVKLAETDLKRVSGVNQLAPSPANALNVERAKLVLEIANLNRNYSKVLSAAEANYKVLQWQIDQLRHDVTELQRYH